MLKILHITSGDLWAGEEVQLFNLVTSLQKRNDLEIVVIILNEGILADKLKESGIKTYLFSEKAFKFTSLIRKTRSVIHIEMPDIIHTHRYKENILSTIASFGKAKLVRTFHGSPEFHYTWKEPAQKAVEITDKTINRYAQKRLITVSDALKTKLEEYFPQSKIHAIENGIDVHRLIETSKQKDHSLPENHPQSIKIGIVCRLVPVKRVDVFLKIAALSKQKNLPVEFYIFGDGPLKNDIESQRKALNLENDVHLMGFKDDMPCWLSKLDVALITSDHEGLPMNLLETMALECFVIGHKVGGIPTVLEQGECGYLVENQEPENFVKGIQYFINEKEKVEEQILKAKKRIFDVYSSEVSAKKHANLYYSM